MHLFWVLCRVANQLTFQAWATKKRNLCVQAEYKGPRLLGKERGICHAIVPHQLGSGS
jgi:hypothetical protein